MVYVADDWPIAAALLPYPDKDITGVSMQDVDASRWRAVFDEIAEVGFDEVDLTDSWVRPGDLSPARLDEFGATAAEAGIGLRAVSAIRRSVIDGRHGQANLAYTHRTIEAAARLGCEVVSVGLHQPLTEAQRARLWFWTAEGHRDPFDDHEMWELAVRRLREVGRHAAELGLLLSLELYEDTYLGTADSAVRLVQEIALPNVGLNPDLGNLVRLSRPVESWRELAEKTLPYANFWHVKNYHRYEDPERDCYLAVPAPLEVGFINYREVMRIAIAAGFQGVISVEHYGGDGLSVCTTNARYLRTRILPRKRDYPVGASLVAQGRRTCSKTTSTA